MKNSIASLMFIFIASIALSMHAVVDDFYVITGYELLEGARPAIRFDYTNAPIQLFAGKALIHVNDLPLCFQLCSLCVTRAGESENCTKYECGDNPIVASFQIKDTKSKNYTGIVKVAYVLRLGDPTVQIAAREAAAPAPTA